LVTKVRETALVSLAVTVGQIPTAAQTVPGCGASDPAGYFTGSAISQQNGRLDISLNLRCADERYDGTLTTPLGTFAITNGSAHSKRLHLSFAIGTEAGTIDAIFASDSLQGSFTAVGDSGSLALSRIGEPVASGWEQPTLDLSASEWREDLAFFAHEIVARHGNAFHAIPKVRFDSLVATLDRRLDQLNGDQAYVELDRMANLIGDAHTYITIPSDTPRFPFAIRRFGTEYRVVAVVKGSERMLGSRLVKVQEVPTPVAIQRLWSLTPGDENPSLRQARAESFLSSGMILHGLGITPARDAVTLTLEDDAGQEARLNVRAVPGDPADTLPWKDVFTVAPLLSQQPHKTFWYEYLPRARVVYCSFRGYGSLPARAAGLLTLIGRVRPEKVVIDMRQNGGGDFELGLRYLIEPLGRTPYINRRGRLFVAIGRNTFSAGMANAAQFRTRTKAILVGETIGEKPNSYQEPRELLLPNSHLKMRFSTRYYRFVEQGPNAVEPDYHVVPTWVEYRAGHDPVLELVLRYPKSWTAPHRKTPPERQKLPPK
jgi:hypothetical protein